MRTDTTDISQLQEALDSGLPNKNWLRLLETFVPSGVADGLQLRQATGLNRDKLRRTMEKIESIVIGLPPAFRMLDHSIARVGTRGRAPNVYLLGESGAALLQSNGYPDVQPCAMQEDHAIAHALVMLSIHLLATQTGLTTYTDKYLYFGEGKHLRPDHLIILPDSRQYLLEAEQAAVRKLIPRILESLGNKQVFFQSEESRGFLSEVRMVVNVARGREWNRTIKVWREACNLIIQQSNRPLAFRLLAMPLDEFLNAPEWGAETSSRWEEISASFPTVENTESGSDNSKTIALKIDADRSLQDDCVLLNALLQQYNETLQWRVVREPDKAFFTLVNTIYSASHKETRNFWEAVSLPHASIYLLRRYIEMHPRLLGKLQKTIHYGQGRIRWNTTTVIHRMQQVVNQFLAYHGWKTNGPLRVEAVTGNWGGTGPFGIQVGKSGPWRLSDDSNYENEIFQALTWLLWALFEYAEELGLGRPEFW